MLGVCMSGIAIPQAQPAYIHVWFPPVCAFVITGAAAEITCTQLLSKCLLYTQAHSIFPLKQTC